MSSPSRDTSNPQQAIDQHVEEAVEEILAAAAGEDSPGARALLALAGDFDGRARIVRLVFEVMRAFGFCAQGLAADIPAEAAGLEALVGQDEGLRWALAFYRYNAELSDINPALAQAPALRESSQRRLEQWLGSFR